MAYQDIEIRGDITDALEWVVGQLYGKVMDIEVYGVDVEDYAAVAFAAVEVAGQGKVDVEGVVVLLKHDPAHGPIRYKFKDIPECAGPHASFCPSRILDLLSPTDSEMALSWRQRCRDHLKAEEATPVMTH